MNTQFRRLAPLITVLVLCPPIVALDFGVSIGRDGTTLAATQFKSQPLLATGACDLRSGGHFVLRLRAGYGVLLYRHRYENGPNGLFNTYDYSGLDALRIQAAPCAEVPLPMLPVYVRAGMGCGFHLNWIFQEDTELDDGRYASSRVRGLDVTALVALGIRMSRRFSLELSSERLLADWSLTSKQNYTWDYIGQQWVKGYYSSTTSLNWNDVVDPGYSIGIVLTL